MGLSDTGKAFLIVIIFGLIQLSITLSIGLARLKKNWNKYRCNPLVIPLAHLVDEDPIETFKTCTKEIQWDFMKTILKPIYNSFSHFLDSGNLFVGILESLKTGLVIQHGSTLNVMGDLGKRFNILLVQLSLAFITVSDMFGKVSSMVSVIFYLITTSVKVGEALNADLPGTVIRVLSKFKK
jgi:hypothetical protein